MSHLRLGKKTISAFLVASSILGVGVATTDIAEAQRGRGQRANYSNVAVRLEGGDARALGTCMNYARLQAKRGRPAQSNFCESIAIAEGGNVKLDDVNVAVLQDAGRRRNNYSNVDVVLRGGDAEAIASCVNYLQGRATQSQRNTCASSAIATGGNVTLDDVNIEVVQY
jgi:hypothetical protein